MSGIDSLYPVQGLKVFFNSLYHAVQGSWQLIGEHFLQEDIYIYGELQQFSEKWKKLNWTSSPCCVFADTLLCQFI